MVSAFDPASLIIAAVTMIVLLFLFGQISLTAG